MKTISIIVNKSWEVEPCINALINYELRPTKFPYPEILNSPRDKNHKMDLPRAVFKVSSGGVQRLLVKIWCIQDLMYINIPPDPSNQSSSSSSEKYRVLPQVLLADNPDLIIAVGTAGHPSSTSFNGSIVIGGYFFLHDGHPDNPRSNLKHPDLGKILPSNVNSKIFDLIDKDFKAQIEYKFLKTPRNPADNSVCIASKNYTTISSVNVTDYSEYAWVDHEAIAHFNSIEKKLPIYSIETTHGVIRLSSQKPMLFVSAITDRLGYFDNEVTPSQNYVAAFNAGIFLGQFICSVCDFAIDGSFLAE